MKRLFLIAVVAGMAAGLGPQAAAQRPDLPEEHLLRGCVLERADRCRDAFDEFARVNSATPGWGYVDAEALDAASALCAAGAGRDDAEALLRDYVVRYPEGPSVSAAWFALGSLCFDRGQWRSAADRFSKAEPGNLPRGLGDEYWFKYGYSEFLDGRYAAAVPLLARVDFRSDYYPHAQYLMGYAEYRNGNYRAAKDYFTVIADHPDYGRILPFYILQIEFNEGNFRYVRENGGALIGSASGRRAVELNRIVGESWFQTGGWSEASRYFAQYEKLGGAMDREMCYMIGFSAYMEGEYDRAIAYLDRASGPDDRLSQNAAYHLADCYLRAGRPQQAMQSFAMASAEGYDDAISEDALFNYGKLQYELGGGYFNEAINVLDRYLKLYPSSPRAAEVKEYLAAAYYNSRNYDAAYQAIRQVENPDNDMRAALQKITYFRALEYYRDGDYDSAARLLDESLANRFNAKYTALAGYWQGELAYRRGDTDEAVRLFENYIHLSPAREPENLAARYNLGYVYFGNRDWDASGRWLDDFVSAYDSRDSYAADAYNRLGDIAYSKRSFWRAIELYDKAAAMGTEERYYSAFRRAMTLGMVQRPERKIESLNDIVRKGEGPYVAEAAYELGRACIGQQRYREGAAALEDFIADYPSSPRYASALNELALAYLNTGDEEKALKYYRMVMDRERNSEAARNAMNGIRTIYVERNDVETYFRYAERMGIETDLGEVQRDSLAFVAAQRVYLSGERKRAAVALDNYIASYSKGRYMDDALYFAGENASAMEDDAKALVYFRRLTEMPSGDFTVRGLERRSALAYKSGHYDEAASAYRRLAAAVDQPARDAALTGYMKSVVASGDDARIIAVAAEVLPQAATQNLRRETRFAEASALRRSGRNDEALRIYRELASDVSSAEGAESAYRVIEAVHASGDDVEAERRVYDFADANSPHYYWLGRSFLVLGDIYAGAGDSFQARATYQSIVDGYPDKKDGIVKQARERIAALK